MFRLAVQSTSRSVASRHPRPVGQENIDEALLAEIGGHMESRPAQVVLRVDISATEYQKADDLVAAPAGGGMQSGLAAPIDGVQVCASVQEKLNDLPVTGC